MSDAKHLRLLPSGPKFDPKVQRAMDNIIRCIVDLVVKNKGEVSLQKVADLTGLKNVGPNITADIIRFMVKEGIVELRGNTIRGSVAKMTEIIEQYKTLLPTNNNKLWSENEYVTLSEMRLEGKDPEEISKKMGRSVRSIQMQSTLLRKAYKMIPIIERHKAVRDFASKFKSPNPKD